jgi:hypothetical protein
MKVVQIPSQNRFNPSVNAPANLEVPQISPEPLAPQVDDNLWTTMQRQVQEDSRPRLPLQPVSGAMMARDIAEDRGVSAGVPPLEGSGIERYVGQQPVTSDESNAQLLSNPFKTQPTYKLAVDENNEPIFNEKLNDFERVQVQPQEFEAERQSQLDTLKDQTSAFEGEKTGTQIAESLISNAKDKPSMAKYKLKDDATIYNAVSNAATAVNRIVNGTGFTLFDADSPIGIIGGNPDMSPGFEIAKVNGEDPNNIINNRTQINAAVGFGLLSAVGQTLSASKLNTSKSQINASGKVSEKAEQRMAEDATPEVDFTNAGYASAKRALNNMGVSIKPDTLMGFLQVATAHRVYTGELRQMKDPTSGKFVLAASHELKDQQRELEILTAALSGEDPRPSASTVPLGMSLYIKPGSTMSAKSLTLPNSMYNAANLAKEILGNIAERFYQKAVSSKIKRLKSTTDSFDEQKGYSIGPFASQFKVDEAAFQQLMDRTAPDKDYVKGNPMSEMDWEDKKKKHAQEEIQNRLAQAEYDIKNALNSAGKLLFTHYTNNSSNHRFNRMSKETDLVSSKVVRDMLGAGAQSLTTADRLFEIDEINRLKSIAKGVFNVHGEDRHMILNDMSMADRSALGLMQSAVLNYYTFTGPNIDKKVAKESEISQIMRYTPEIGNYLASLGEQYNSWLNDSEGQKDHDNIVKYLSGMVRGEEQANQNLWDDMFNLENNLKELGKKNSHIKLTAMNYDDGNQNGIMIQGLYAGNYNSTERLGVFDPTLGNMREFLLSQMDAVLKSVFADDKFKLDSWRAFFAEADKSGTLSSDLGKQPLMEHSYSKDAGMFFEEMYEFIEDPSYNALIRKHLLDSGAYSGDKANTTAIAEDLNKAMEGGLRKVVNPTFGYRTAALGNMFAIMDTVPNHPGTAGDSYQYSTADIGYVRDAFKDVMSRDITPEGEEYLTKELGVFTTGYEVKGTGAGIEMSSGQSRLNPSHGKGRIGYFNKRTGSYEYFDNVLGSTLRRLLAVMPIQSTDADLLKLMLAYVNGNREIPHYVGTVHDSVITSMDTVHLYRNAYNNIAIPMAIPEIKKFAKRLWDNYQESKSDLMNRIEGEKYIGIGARGDYPAMGATFDSLYNNLLSDTYKQRRMSMHKPDETPQQAWNKYVEKTSAILENAREYGWKPNISNLAVNSKQFKKLFELAEDVNGIEDQVKPWVADFADKVQKNYEALVRHPLVRAHGIAQMSSALGSSKVKNNFEEGYVQRAKNFADKYEKSYLAE